MTLTVLTLVDLAFAKVLETAFFEGLFMEAAFFIGWIINVFSHTIKDKYYNATMSDHHARLHVFIAHSGVASRRRAEALISDGRVTVNGITAVIGQQIYPDEDLVEVNGQPITPISQKNLYFLVNKPSGYVSTTSDELGRPTILELLPIEAQDHRLYPVGRLDLDSQGLMLLTNDGDYAYQLTHPKFQVRKTYQAKVDRVLSDKAVEHLRRGVYLKEGKTSPAEVLLLPEKGDRWMEITIHEGRNRQVRRMIERVGYNIERLVRVRLGKYQLEELGALSCLKVEKRD